MGEKITVRLDPKHPELTEPFELIEGMTLEDAQRQVADDERGFLCRHGWHWMRKIGDTWTPSTDEVGGNVMEVALVSLSHTDVMHLEKCRRCGLVRRKKMWPG